MPYCCKTNRHAAIILGILFLLVEVINGILRYEQHLEILKEFLFIKHYGKMLQYSLLQIVNVFFNGLLVFGATWKNDIAITIWTVFAILKIFATILIAILLTFKIHFNLYICYTYYHNSLRYCVGSVPFNELKYFSLILGIAIVQILFYIWAIIVAKNAKKELMKRSNTDQDNTLCDQISQSVVYMIG